MKSIHSFPGPAALLGTLAILMACSSIGRTDLTWLGDHQDDRDLGDTGETPRMRHPQGLDVGLSAVLAREESDGARGREAVFVTFEVHNATGETWALDWRNARLRGDDGRSFVPTKLERWNEAEGRWEKAADVVAPGDRETLVMTVPTGSRLELVLDLCLKWSYRLGVRRLEVASFFRNA